MNIGKFALVCAAALIAAGASTDIDSRTNWKVQPGSKLWVEGTSNVQDFKCQAKRVDGWVVFGSSGESDTFADRLRAAGESQVSIPVGLLDCDNGTMNTHMLKALKAASHPEIKYRISTVAVTPQSGAAAKVQVSGNLTMAGQTRAVTIPVTATEAGGKLRVQGSKQLDMTDFGVEPPSLMFGAMKVNKPVTIGFDITLAP